MMMKDIAVVTAGLILASGTALMAMGNKSDDSDRNAGMRSSAPDASYSSGVSTGKMMRSGMTNGMSSGSSFDTGTRSSSGAGSSGSAAPGSSTLGTGSGVGTDANKAGTGSSF